MKKTVSIIIVNYKVRDELFNCLRSVYESKTKASFEIIVVDNDEIKTIGKDLKKEFPQVIYLSSKTNLGFGGGNNLGFRKAKGDFIYFLNPDTKMEENSIDSLVQFLKKDKKIGIVAPLLLNQKGIPYPLQGTLELTPKRAIFSHSIINKLFPGNKVSRQFWQIGWDKTKVKEVDVVPGTAFMIRREIFEEISGFDQKFFLYFEEFDLCKKVREMGYKVFINPQARVIHLWESSTKQRNDINEIFNKSRFYYFRKNYGLLSAILTNSFLNLGKNSIMIFFILMLSVIPRLYKLDQLMPFIGDQGWFYLSARDFVLTGQIPLVGITSSHTWIHQGPIWTYLLAFTFWIFGFNPLNGAYLTIILDILTIYLLYFFGKKVFNTGVGLIAALIYSFSPLVIMNTRMAYHTSPIPLASLVLFYSVYKWIKGNVNYFPVVLFFLALLYNLELATFVFDFLVIGILIYGFIKRKDFVVKLLNKKVLGLSFIGSLLPMIPFLLYDLNKGFPQTFKFGLWLGYKASSFLGFIKTNAVSGTSVSQMINFVFEKYQLLVFFENQLLVLILLVSSLAFLFYSVFKTKNHNGYLILGLFIFVPFLGFMVNKTPSDAYLPIFFPFVILLTAAFYSRLLTVKYLKVPIVVIILVTLVLNFNTLVKNNYFMSIPLSKQINAVSKIISEAEGRRYSLKGRGEGSQFSSFTMNYEYLLWWKGFPPEKNDTSLVFIIEQKRDKILVEGNKK